MSAGQPEDDEGFLSRWSRRKGEVARQETSEADAGASPLPPACVGDGSGMGGRTGQGSSTPKPIDSLSHPGPPHRKRGEGEEPEMIEPPSLDLVDKDFDVAHWLKQNVPESWKLAALRRAWESDPAIRDFENPARDYALDWNTPGGAPGYGPLTESDDVESIVRGIFGDAPPSGPEPEMVAEATGDSMSHQLSSNDEEAISDAAVQEIDPQGKPSSSVRRSGDDGEGPDNGEIPPKSTAQVYAAVQNSTASELAPMRVRKRGGGAIPG